MSLFSSLAPAQDPAPLVDDSRAEALEQAIALSAHHIAAGFAANSADAIVADATKFHTFLTTNN